MHCVCVDTEKKEKRQTNTFKFVQATISLVSQTLLFFFLHIYHPKCGISHKHARSTIIYKDIHTRSIIVSSHFISYPKNNMLFLSVGLFQQFKDCHCIASQTLLPSLYNTLRIILCHPYLFPVSLHFPRFYMYVCVYTLINTVYMDYYTLICVYWSVCECNRWSRSISHLFQSRKES